MFVFLNYNRLSKDFRLFNYSKIIEIMRREERHLTAQCLYFINLYIGTGRGRGGGQGHHHGQSIGGQSSKERWETEPGDPRQGWDYKIRAIVRVRINNHSWVKERG